MQEGKELYDFWARRHFDIGFISLYCCTLPKKKKSIKPKKIWSRNYSNEQCNVRSTKCLIADKVMYGVKLKLAAESGTVNCSCLHCMYARMIKCRGCIAHSLN